MAIPEKAVRLSQFVVDRFEQWQIDDRAKVEAQAAVPKRRRGLVGLTTQVVVLALLAFLAFVGAWYLYHYFLDTFYNNYDQVRAAASNLATGLSNEGRPLPEGVNPTLALPGSNDEVTSQHIDVLLAYAANYHEELSQATAYVYGFCGTGLVMTGLAFTRAGKLIRVIANMED